MARAPFAGCVLSRRYAPTAHFPNAKRPHGRNALMGGDPDDVGTGRFGLPELTRDYEVRAVLSTGVAARVMAEL
ncbi:MAG: hypothetical protein AAF718_17675 [Pseudomonadota bacterium]